MPIKYMIFESGALFKTTEILKSVGARLDMPLIVVMDESTMRRDGGDLKSYALETLRKDGWQVRVWPTLLKKRGSRAGWCSRIWDGRPGVHDLGEE